MKHMRFLILLIVGFGSACKDSATTKSSGGNAVVESSSEKELKAELVALRSDLEKTQGTLKTLQTAIDDHNTEISALNGSVNGVVLQVSSKALWLYDGNHVKRQKVITVYDRGAWKEALVEIETDVTARYQLSRFADANAQQAPEKFVTPSGVIGDAVFYSLPGCTGTPMMGDFSSGADFGQAGSIGNNVVWVASTSQRLNGYSSSSYYDGSSCIENVGSSAGRASVAVIKAATLYSYPNPLTVGP